MAVKRTRTYRNNYYTDSRKHLYVYGNAAPNPEVLPEQRNGKAAERRKTSSQVKKNRNRAMNMSVAYVTFLMAAAITAVLLCVMYLRLQSEIINRSENITALQEELAQLTEENDAAYQAAQNSINLQTIRERAINELGMVSAADGQVVEYESEAGDSVTQYNDIPSEGILAESDNTTE